MQTFIVKPQLPLNLSRLNDDTTNKQCGREGKEIQHAQ